MLRVNVSLMRIVHSINAIEFGGPNYSRNCRNAVNISMHGLVLPKDHNWRIHPPVNVNRNDRCKFRSGKSSSKNNSRERSRSSRQRRRRVPAVLRCYLCRPNTVLLHIYRINHTHKYRSPRCRMLLRIRNKFSKNCLTH